MLGHELVGIDESLDAYETLLDTCIEHGYGRSQTVAAALILAAVQVTGKAQEPAVLLDFMKDMTQYVCLYFGVGGSDQTVN